MPEISLTDTSSRPYNLATTPSKPVTLLFFGYTHCPDVCIAVLSDVALALQRLSPADRDQIQFIFVTTDPARDKEKQIRRYLDRFNPSFVGLTGSLSTIKRAATQVGVDIEGVRLRGWPLGAGDRFQPEFRRRDLDTRDLDRSVEA
jgi:protein SCO1